MEGKLFKTGDGYRLSLGDVTDPYSTFQGMYAVSNEYLSEDYQLQKLSLKNCQEIENGYDLDELAKEACNITDPLRLDSQKYKQDPYFRIGFNKGFQKALEILGDKKFSEFDITKAFEYGWNQRHFDKTDEYELRGIQKRFIQSLQQTQWSIEIVMICPHPEDTYVCGIQYGCDEDGCNHPNQVPYLDADGCLILKRKV